jgi:hypothetical protein
VVTADLANWVANWGHSPIPQTPLGNVPNYSSPALPSSLASRLLFTWRTSRPSTR